MGEIKVKHCELSKYGDGNTRSSHALSLIYSPLKQFNGSHTASSQKFIKITWKKVKKLKLAGNKI